MRTHSEAVIFVGPSLSAEDIAQIFPDVEVLPPIQRGDIDALMRREVKPKKVGVIDGKFLFALSISPKEILKAMYSGVRFYGSSSMGALRAAELDRYGMVGVGRIYKLYADELIDGDDEVALIIDEATLSTPCVPLASMRLACKDLLSFKLISGLEAEVIVCAAKKLYFPERCYEAVFAQEIVLKTLGTTRAKQLQELFANAEEAKNADAKQLLKMMRG
jgi:hypothetical protein